MPKQITRVFSFLGSYGLAVVLLILLLVLVLFGTLEQVNQGLYEVQKRYFESAFVVHWLYGVIPLPLPGAYLLLVLLSVNLFLGSIVFAPKNWRRPGMLIAHSGILLMLFAAFVAHRYAENGHMTLYEGESADYYESYYDWEISIAEASAAPGASLQEYIISQDQFTDLALPMKRTFFAADLPFELELMGYMPNAMPRLASAGEKQSVDGVVLEPAPPARDAEMNAAGLFAAVAEKGMDQRKVTILWGLSRAPWVVTAAGKDYAITLRHRRATMPFTIALKKFTRELHPRTGIASNYQSEVTQIENGASRQVVIKMNEPLRAQGYTLYQASWGPQNAPEGTPLFSTLAVVSNPADQWPLYSCVITSFGLLLHFIQKLWRYLRAQHGRLA